MMDTLPAAMLRHYRNPPGRKLSDQLLKIHAALEALDDSTGEIVIRDVVDAAALDMLYLMGANFKSRITTTLSRGALSESLTNSVCTKIIVWRSTLVAYAQNTEHVPFECPSAHPKRT